MDLISLSTHDLDSLQLDLEDWGPRLGAESGSPQTSGRVLMTVQGSESGIRRCTPGGWSGRWDITETVTKFYTISR